MTQESTHEAFVLINTIALNVIQKCDEPIPEIIQAALDEIASLAQYQGIHGNPISEERRKLFGLSDTPL